MDKKELARELTFLVVLAIFMFLWSVIQPYDSSPDEAMRYDICKYIFQNHSLPHGGDPAIRNVTWGYSYAFFPILSYMVGAVFMMITSIFSEDAFALLMSARMVSIFCGVGMAWFAFRIGDKVWKNRAYKWLFVCLVTLLPQSVFIFTYVNNDSLALLATAMIIYAWIIGLESKWNYKSCTLLAVGIILCALSYYNTYGVILASMLIFAVSLWKARKERTDLQDMIKKGAFIAVIVLAGISWWFIRSYILYDGDFLGMTTSEHYSQLYGIESIKPSNRQTPYMRGMNPIEMLLPFGWLRLTVMSFIGCFGYMNVPLVPRMYMFYIGVLGLGVLGIFLWNRKIEFKTTVMFYVGLLITAVIPNVLNFVHSYFVDYQPQGRYSMPMLVPLMLTATLGFQKLANNRKWLGAGLAILWSLMAVYSYYAIFRVQYIQG